MFRQTLVPTYKEPPFFIFPESVGWYRDEPQHYVDRSEGTWTTYSIHLVIRGKGYLEYEGKVYALSRGDAFIYFPMQAQKYYSSQEEPWEIRWVHFYGPQVKSYFYDQGIRQPLWTHKRVTEWEDTFHQLLLEAEAHNLLQTGRLSTLTYAIVAEFIHQSNPLSMSRTTSTSDRIELLLPLMQKKACEPFSLAEWAAQAEVSVHYFCKLFHKTTSMTPVEFITLCRIQMAKQWLVEKPTWPIKVIAEEVGYPNISYFNLRFHEQEGITPSEYRRSRKPFTSFDRSSY